MANLGIMLGSAVQGYNNQQKAFREEDQFKRQQEEWARQDAVDKAQKEATEWYNQGLESIKAGKIGEFAPRAMEYLNNTDFNGKAKGSYVAGQDGKHYAMYHEAPEGPPQLLEITPQMAQQSLTEMYRHRLQSADPRQALAGLNSDRTYGVEREKLGIHRQEVADKGQYQRGILDWHTQQASRPTFMQGGDGRIVGITPDGKQIGTYGNARPIAATGHEEKPLSTTEQSLLGGIMDRFSAETDPAKRALIGQEYQMAQSRILLGRGRVPNLPNGMVSTPKPQRVYDPKVVEAAVQDLNLPAGAFDAKYGPGMRAYIQGNQSGEGALDLSPGDNSTANNKPVVAPARGFTLPERVDAYGKSVAAARAKAIADEEDRLSRGGR